MSPTAATCLVGSNERNVERKGKKTRNSERMEVREMGKNGEENGRNAMTNKGKGKVVPVLN
jgi:hypothetical protein